MMVRGKRCEEVEERMVNVCREDGKCGVIVAIAEVKLE